MAFGDEVTQKLGNVGGRTNAQGYGKPDDVRKQYTGYERDKESGLDYAQARYYNSNHGRFTSVDPLMASANVRNPQTFNRYSYVLNSPYKFSDPLGLLPSSTGACGNGCQNSGPQMDGSAFRGRDASFDWAYEYDNLLTQVAALAASIWTGVMSRYQSSPPPSEPEPKSTNPIVLDQDKSLVELFTDENGIVRSTRHDPEYFFNGGISHFRFAEEYPDGIIFGVHVYGDESGNTNANVYVPEYFDKVEYVKGSNSGRITAYNTKTGERLDFYHISGVSSQKQLDENMKKTNNAGSRFIGQTGGKGGDNPGYKHSCIRFFRNNQGYNDYQNAANPPTLKDFKPLKSSSMGDLRKLFKK